MCGVLFVLRVRVSAFRSSLSSLGAANLALFSFVALLVDDQVSAAGLLVCLVVSFLATDFFPVKQEKDIEWVRRHALGPRLYLLAFY